MAKGEARGIKGYIPTVRGVVKILIVLVVLKLVINFAWDKLPASVQTYVPMF